MLNRRRQLSLARREWKSWHLVRGGFGSAIRSESEGMAYQFERAFEELTVNHGSDPPLEEIHGVT